MALSFICLVLILLFFRPSLSFTCPNSVRCGNIDINYPFFTSTTPPECRGKFLIECDFLSPMIQFKGVDYKIMNISYLDNVITIQDQGLSGLFHNSQCSFLYKFTVPIPDFDFYGHHPTLRYNSSSCLSEGYESFNDFFHLTYNSTICRDYSIYYWNESDHQLNHISPVNCLGSYPTLFEWVLSYTEANGNLSFSLLAAGFSHQSELQMKCFNCQLIGKNCSRDDDSSCMCEHSCLHRASKEIFSTFTSDK